MSVLKIENLNCIRGSNQLFQDLSCQLHSGELLQINGANGSGKSSLIAICAGLLYPSGGSVIWNDKNISACRYEYQRQLCYVGIKSGVCQELTVKENIRIMQALFGFSTLLDEQSLLEQLDLAGVADKLLVHLSAGQRQRVSLAKLLISKAQLWLLDEPFNTLDAAGKIIISDLLGQHCQAGGMVIFATHQPVPVKAGTLKQLQLGPAYG